MMFGSVVGFVMVDGMEGTWRESSEESSYCDGCKMGLWWREGQQHVVMGFYLSPNCIDSFPRIL